MSAVASLQAIKARIDGGAYAPLWLMIAQLPQVERRPVIDALHPLIGGKTIFDWSYRGRLETRPSDEVRAVVERAIAETER